jgi:hypothetical protein
MHDLFVRDLEQARNRTLGLTAAHLFDFGPERAGEFVRDLGKRDPDARLNLLLTDGRPIIATRWNDTPASCAPAAASSSRASPMTTTRAGPTSPTITSSTWPTAW